MIRKPRQIKIISRSGVTDVIWIGGVSFRLALSLHRLRFPRDRDLEMFGEGFGVHY